MHTFVQVKVCTHTQTKTKQGMLMSPPSAPVERSKLRRGEPGQQRLHCFTLSPALLTELHSSTSTKVVGHNTDRCQRTSPHQPPSPLLSSLNRHTAPALLSPPNPQYPDFSHSLKAKYRKAIDELMPPFPCQHAQARKSLSLREVWMASMLLATQ